MTERKPDPELGCGYLMLAGFVAVVGALALLILLERNPRGFGVLVILTVAMIAGAAGAIWMYRRTHDR